MPPVPPERPAWRPLAAVLGVVFFVAVGLRFWQIDQLPPGLHYDEAFNNLHAQRVAEGEPLSFYVRDEFGEEPMHIALVSLLFRAVGPTPLGGRLVSAALGVLAVLGLYGLGAELFRAYGRGPARRIALLSSLFLATWYWPFHYNRIGMEPSTVPVAAVLAFWALWRALRTYRTGDALLAGAGVALCLYTYPAGRAVPLAAGLAGLGHLLLAPRSAAARSPRAWRTYGLIALAAGAIVSPLALVFVRDPGWLALRMSQTTESTVRSLSPLAALIEGIRSTLLGFFWRGDLNWRQNLPGRPMFDPLQLVSLALGLALCLRRPRLAPHWFLPLWVGVALLPTILTEYPPHFGRALGATPPLALLAGLGLWAGARWVLRQARRAGASPAPRLALGAAALGLPLAASGGLAFDTYFNRWARAPELYRAFDVGLFQIGEYAAGLAPAEPIYLSPVPGEWYTLRFAAGENAPGLRTFNGRECLVFPARTEQTTHFIVVTARREDSRSLNRLQAAFPAGHLTWQTLQEGVPYAVDYTVPADQPALLEPREPLAADFGPAPGRPGRDRASLLGYDLDTDRLAPGQQLTLRLWWQAQAEFDTDYTVFVHLVGPARTGGGIVWAQRDTRPCDTSYPTLRWQPGEVIWDDYHLAMPASLAAGTYHLRVGLYDLATGRRLPAVSAVAPVVDSAVEVATFNVPE